jgi:xylan 1,4-beta-xylosidase
MNRRTFVKSASMAGASVLASHSLASLAQEAGAAKSQNVQIWTDGVSRPLPHSWEECIGSDRAIVGTRAQWLSDLELVRKSAGIKSVRFHGLFNDEMGAWPSGNQPNFLYVDTVFDTMLDRGVKPFVELSFMPNKLASGQKSILWYHGNTTPPVNMSQWGELVGAPWASTV